MQWLQHSNQSNVDNLNNVRRENQKHTGNKKEEYLLVIIDGFETHRCWLHRRGSVGMLV